MKTYTEQEVVKLLKKFEMEFCQNKNGDEWYFKWLQNQIKTPSLYCDCKNPIHGIDDKGKKYCKWCDRDFEQQ